MLRRTAGGRLSTDVRRSHRAARSGCVRLGGTPHQRGHCRLAAARFAHQPQGLAGLNVERDAVDGRTTGGCRPRSVEPSCKPAHGKVALTIVDLTQRAAQPSSTAKQATRCRGRSVHGGKISPATVLDQGNASHSGIRRKRSAAKGPNQGSAPEPPRDRCAGSSAPGRACRDAWIAEQRRTGATSTSWPACMTATRWHISATTPRSWVIRRMAAPVREPSSRSRSRMRAAVETSRPVVGSSAIRSCGEVASAMAIITR